MQVRSERAAPRPQVNIVTPKKGRPLKGLIGRRSAFFRARAGRENRHEGGHIFG